MKKAKNRTAATIGLMALVAGIILIFYFYLTSRTQPIDSSTEKLTEVERILAADLVNQYPETPREVTKLFGKIMKNLYNGSELTDEEIKNLALKIRELYDQEFLDANPEEVYLENLYTDLAAWKEKSRRITNYILINQDQEQKSEIEGRQYASVFISYTLQENSKFTEVWKVLLRQDSNEQWKILGWEFQPKDK